ncbi:MAG: hypothetical protein H6682_14165 [Candidatus Eisenbacteria bacterium]|nr:hypothetical protein [Candidatus Eisenbacteria bacterium]
MRRSGKRALTGLSVLAFVLGTLLGAAPSWADSQSLEPSVNTVINFPAYPSAGGPYITQVTVRPASVSGTTAQVYVVFNEDVNPASIDPDGTADNSDFAVTGFTFASASAGPVANVIILEDAVGAAAGDMLRLRDIGVLEGADGDATDHKSTDLSEHVITTGPVIHSIELQNYEDQDPTNDAILITFDADVQFASGGSVANTFTNTPELAGVTLEATWENDPTNNGEFVTITQDAASTTDLKQMIPGVTKLWVQSGRLRWVDENVSMGMSRQLETLNAGPHLVAAYYDDNGTTLVGEDTDDALWLVMSDPVDPASITGTFADHFDVDVDAGGLFGGAVDGDVSPAIPGSFSSVLLVTNLTGATGIPGGADVIADHSGVSGTALLDYQGDEGLTNAVAIERGPGMLRASYDDQGTPTRTDDQLIIWINEVMARAAVVTDFVFENIDTGSLADPLVVSTETVNQFTRVIITGWEAGIYPTPGTRIAGALGSAFNGGITGQELASDNFLVIEDESRPYALDITENLDMTYDLWNDGDGVDSVFVAWAESGDDSDQYFMYYSATPVLDDDWMNANLSGAIPLGNLQPYGTDGLIRIGFTVTPGVTQSTDGVVLNIGDQMRVIIAAADFQGNLARIQDNNGAAEFFGPFIVGPLCAPRDFITDASSPAEADSLDWDHDVIHVVGDSLDGMVWHYVYGDAGAVACDADSVVVYDGDDPLADNRLGAIVPNADGSFSPIHLDDADALEVDCIYVFNRQGAEFSTGTQIFFDRQYPEIEGNTATPYPDFVFDPWNPYRIYNDGDYVNIRLLANDGFQDCLLPTPGGGPVSARSSLLHIWADFTNLDMTAGNITGFGTPADSILFTSLGADNVDNDGDWDTFTDIDGNGTWDPGEPLNDDVGLDGVGGTNDPGEGDGEMTFGDPYVDENGDGGYDPGETFLNVNTTADGSSGDYIFDPGEPDLDSQDPDEFGWYELRSTSASVRGTVLQGYPLNNPNPEAALDPFTPVPIYVSDNGIDGAERDGAIDRILPFTDSLPDSNRSLSHLTAHMGGDPERRFVAQLDLREPTHAEITYLANETDLGTDAGTNLIAPGSPTYNLGRFVDFTSESLSDDDVLYSRIRVRPSMGAWIDLTLDPGPDFGSDSDANGDSFPGGMLYDEDADSTAAQANGLDDDEDGQVNEVGEGIDFSDTEVHAAAQDSTSDAAATFGNGLHCQNDYRDNDNDAFFVYDSYANGGLVGGGAVGKIYWYNIDESRTNNFDDDNDGQIDEADEAPENVGYGNGENDDNEDGIADGEAVEVPINTAWSVLAIEDPASTEWAAPVPGPGVTGNSIFVDAAHVLGTRPFAGTDSNTEPFYANALAYGEVVPHAFEVLTNSARTFVSQGYEFSGDADSSATQEFNFFDQHSSENLDFELLTEIYGLAADGTTNHQLRLVAYDKAGNVREPWSEPITFTLDLTAPPATIPGCDEIGDPPADFADVSDDPGIQIFDAGKHPGDYTLTGESDDDAVSMTFEASSDPDFDTIDFTHTDITAPFTAEWPGDGMYNVDNYPAANADTVYFRARATDEFGNTTAEEDLCVLTVIVIDGTEPTATLVQVHTDDDLEDGACVPPDSSIALYAMIEDNDGFDWVGGLDARSGDAGIDDDGDGFIDEDDVNGNGKYDEGIDDAGADNIPGTNDDEWNGSADAGNFGETDDYITNDIVKVVFEYNPVGDVPDAGWLPIETVHGDTFSTGGQTVDWTEPVVATWNTLNLETGDYDVRTWAVDVEGNSSELTAFITTVCIRSEPLRAYIQPEVCAGTTEFDLYAIHYIHDYEIDKVRFEYFHDVDGDNCATDLDVGSSWVTIDLDDEADGRGDAVLYFPSAERIGEGDALEDLAFRAYLNTDLGGGSRYMYWDADHDGYSHRDPVVLDDGDGEYNSGDDDQVIGLDTVIPNGTELTDFADDEFYADAEDDELDPSDWIFRENRLNGDNGVLDLWMVSWDGTGLPEGNYLVKAIAIDETNQEDVIEYTCYDPAGQNPEEIEAVRIDTEEPTADFVTITLPDGSVLDTTDDDLHPYVAGVNDWMMICAEGSDDLAKVLFQISLDGGGTWDVLDVNNDQDWFADLDGEKGFQAEGNDAIVNDINGNFVYDDGIDFVQYQGAFSIPEGWPLRPLVGEDEIDGIDNDGDGEIDEDPLSGDPAADEPGSPEDYDSPFCVFVDIDNLPLWADVNVLFRATGYDFNCDTYRADDNPDILAVIIGENMAPEADIIRAEDNNGDEIDVFPAVMDDNGTACITGEDGMNVFVTAEDITAIVSVDLMYRLDPDCYEDLTFEQLQWQSLSDAGYTVRDSVYPYDFAVDVASMPDGAYEIYPSAIDEGGNFTVAPVNPWEFKKFSNATADFAFVSDPAAVDGAPSAEVAAGDEFTITAELQDPDATSTTAVRFWFAPRQLDESIDPTQVQPIAPYSSEMLEETVLSVEGKCDGVVVMINGTAATCHESLGGVAAPTKFDVTVSGNAIVFGARPDAEDEIYVSYNFGSWQLIESGDEFAPYTVEWTADEGGVPDPADFGWDEADAWDLIAQARFDINGDWLFGGDCDVDETLRSEGNYIKLLDQDRPLVQIWGLNYSAEPRENQDDYPDWNLPGNPLFTCGDDINDDEDWDHAFILSGKETDVFVTAVDQGGGSIESVDLRVTSENPETGDQTIRDYEMTKVGSGVTMIDALTVTFYPEDYTQWDPADIENVILQVSTDGGSTYPYKYEMTAGTDCYQANPRLFVGTTHDYRFQVDLVGDTQDYVLDARNNNGAFFGPLAGDEPDFTSQMIIPDTPFWHVSIDQSSGLAGTQAPFSPHEVHRAVATATDDSGNTGTNLNSGTPGDADEPQGAVVFIYDVEDPVVQSLTLLDELDRPFNTARISPAVDYRIWATVNDSPFEDFNVLRVDWVEFQYSPNQGGIWITIDRDDDTTDGWAIDWAPDDQSDDGYDNDLDGIYDEDDEKISPVWLRAVAKDCGYNVAYGEPVEFMVDAAEPFTCAALPRDGAVFGYSDQITIEGSPEGDWVPSAGTDDIAEVRFQARFSNLYFVDQTYNGVGHAGDYDNGIDEIWIDLNSNDLFDASDEVVYAGADGFASTPDNSGANKWFTLDPTPQDNSDNPWLTGPGSGTYSMVWTPTGSQFTQYGVDGDGGYIDEYVRVRMVAKDTAGNDEQDSTDEIEPCEKLIILNDTADNNPRAFVMAVDDEWVDPIEVFCISGMEEVVVGGSVAHTNAVAHVNLYRITPGGETGLVGIDTNLDDNEFEVLWKADEEAAEGTYVLFATVTDFDDNESDMDDATRINVKIDRAGPSVDYTNWVDAVEYVDDGIVDHSSFAIHPDQDTWDVLFTVHTVDTDVASIELQWRFASDPEGLWRGIDELLDDGDGMFDYEPNLNNELGQAWRYHVENWPDQLLEGGPMHFRALATDQAGNTNALAMLTNAQELTADGNGPSIYDWNDDSVTNQVEVGSTVNFEITLEDDWTDVVVAQLEYSADGGDTWTYYATDNELEGVQIDTGLGLWVANFAWVAPSWVVRDTDYEFRVVAYDTAWNREEITPPHAFTITVEDNAAPDRTKIVDIFAAVNYTADDEDGTPDPSDEHREHDVWADVNGNGEFDAGDILVSEGYDDGVQDPEGDEGIVVVGDECNTFPRWVGESMLTDENDSGNDRQDVKVSDVVTLMARTWADDYGIGNATDDGIATVSFWAWPVDGNDNPTTPILIGKDEVAPSFNGFYNWHLTWNTLERDAVTNDLLFPDGRYKLTASAIDEEGNEEDLGSLDFTNAVIVVDNTAPEATMDLDPATAEFELGPVDVERNEWFTLYSRVLMPGTDTENLTEDDYITWYYKRDRDLNMSASWAMVPPEAGLTPEDGNPDYTRPYSFDVQVGELTAPADTENGLPLAVGELYNFAPAVGDEVCNTTSHIANFGAGHGLTIKIVDTIAPHLEFVEAVRALPTRDGVEYGDDDVIYNPTQIHAQAFESITARLLTGHRDLEYVEFVWRPVGSTDWNLIDADLTGSEDMITWSLGDWDLRTLGAGNWIEVAAVGVDDVGNVDTNPDILRVYVDYEAPSFAMVGPDPENLYWCDYDYVDYGDGYGRIMDLIVNVDRGTEGLHDDVYDVIWEWKLASADSTEWSQFGVASSDDLYDDTLNYYSNTLDLEDLDGSDLYDLRVTVVDEAGNYNRMYQWKRVVDVDHPDYVQVSNISWEGDDTTQDPNDQGQYTDITAGTLVEVFGTASDDEPNLPNYTDPVSGDWYETPVGYMQFQVAVDIGNDGDLNDGEVWRDLGTVQFDPSDLDDISAQTASVYWNTTGLAEGQYFVRVGAKDVCGNPVSGFTWSDPVNVRVTDSEPPVARIVCFDADQQPHGINPPSIVTAYALAESDPSIVDVVFQYNIVDGNEMNDGPSIDEWVNFGISTQETSQDDYTTEAIWSATIDPTQFDDTVTQLWVRALAKDDAGNRYGDNPEDVVPTMLVNLATDMYGAPYFEPAPMGDDVVESVEVMIEGPYVAVLTVKMASATETPRVIGLSEINNPEEYPSEDNPMNYSPGVEDYGLVRSLDDPTVWRGYIDLYDYDWCSNYTFCVTGLDGESGIAKWIDHGMASIKQFDVTNSLGTNGTVRVDAYDGLGMTLDIHPGASMYDGCLLVSPTWAPILTHDEAMYLTPVEDTAYYVEALDGFVDQFLPGYEPMMSISYDESMLPEGASEEDLAVRRWGYSYYDLNSAAGGDVVYGWSMAGLSHVQIDTENNRVNFRVSDLYSYFGGPKAGGYPGGANIFQLFLKNDSAPVLFSSVWPASPYYADWWTDADPVIVTYLREPGGEGIDASEVELLIDGEYWATWLSGEGDADYVRGSGKATLTYVNSDQTVMELVYYHSIFSRDWLTDGTHTLTVRFMSETGEWLDGSQEFHVDRTSPDITFDGGYVSNPDLINAQGYMNPANDRLEVQLKDSGSGILFKPNRPWFLPDFDCDGVIDAGELQYDPLPEYVIGDGDFDWYGDYGQCWIQVDWGVKYDLWWVDLNEDDQRDIDEIEERVLLHQGTADELLPWVTPAPVMGSYDPSSLDPATNTLTVPVPVVGGGVIGDKDVLEVTWYSEKTIEAYNDGPGYQYYCGVDTLNVGGQIYYVYDSDCTYDADSQEMHIYEQGILDWAGNTGSRYVEQRFIVDMSAPSCEIYSPSTTVTPDGNLDIHVVIADDGAGIDDSDIMVTVTNPEGEEVEIMELTIENGTIHGHVHGPLDRGEYTVTVSATDRLGNECVTTRTAKAENAVLAMTQTSAYPNPFNPADGMDATITFDLSKAADVTVRIYDFGGNYVTTIASNDHVESGVATYGWGGEAEDGTDLANGTYFARVIATDGTRTEEKNLKVVLWRE